MSAGDATAGAACSRGHAYGSPWAQDTLAEILATGPTASSADGTTSDYASATHGMHDGSCYLGASSDDALSTSAEPPSEAHMVPATQQDALDITAIRLRSGSGLQMDDSATDRSTKSLPQLPLPFLQSLPDEPVRVDKSRHDKSNKSSMDTNRSIIRSSTLVASMSKPANIAQPSGGKFVKAGETMPSASTARRQLWESAASSSSNTLVGVPSNSLGPLRLHRRSTSAGTTVEDSRRSSSVECEDDAQLSAREAGMANEDGEQAAKPTPAVPVARQSLVPMRQRPWAGQDRPRSGSTIRFQPGLPPATTTPSRQSHIRQSSSPQLSPLMPLVFQLDLPIGMLSYTNRVARILHTFFPVLYFAQIPLTLFFDFNIIYAFVQIAIHPTVEGQSGGASIQGVPRVNPWWIAVGFYALCTFTWFVVVFLVHDSYYNHYKVWKNRKS